MNYIYIHYCTVDYLFCSMGIRAEEQDSDRLDSWRAFLEAGEQAATWDLNPNNQYH